MIAKNSDNAQELFPIVDTEGRVIGKASRGECHSGSMLLHPVVHLHVFNERGELFLQKRPMWKDIQPGRWDTAVGGHVDYGETVGEALLREAAEELGLTDFEPKQLISYLFESARERELVNVFRCECKADAVKPSEELDGGRWFSPEEIADRIGAGFFTPNFEQEYSRLSEAKLL